MKQNGSCLCGEVRYEIDSDFKLAMNCHCGFCRKAHAAPYVTAALVPLKGLNITSGESKVKKYSFGKEKNRCFCSKCGTSLFNEIPFPGFVSLMLGTLEKPELVEPRFHVNTRSKLPTLEIIDSLPQYDEFPDAAEIGKMLAG